MQFFVRIRTTVNDVKSFVIQFVEYAATNFTRSNYFECFDNPFPDFAAWKIWFF